MAVKCPTCHSADTQAGLQNNQCLRCRTLFDFDGVAVEAGMDASTREALQARMAPRQQVVIGNLADLQRWGAEVAVSGGGNGVALPLQDPPYELATPAQAEAAQGRVTVETERAGLTGGAVSAPKSSAKTKK